MHYEIHKIKNKIFKFKLDLNPVNSKYEPHIWHRHQIEPEQVITAYFNISKQLYNHKYKRYEAYSTTDKLHIYYNNINFTTIMIITAFKI